MVKNLAFVVGYLIPLYLQWDRMARGCEGAALQFPGKVKKAEQGFPAPLCFNQW